LRGGVFQARRINDKTKRRMMAPIAAWMTAPTSPDPIAIPSLGNSDDNIANQTKASALNDKARDPAGGPTYNEPNEQICHGLLLGNLSERRNGHHFLRFQLFRLLGFTIAVSVTLGYGFFHDGPVAINPMPTIDDNFAAPANANKRHWRFPGFGHD
jgi:hypothetical protein